MSESYLPRIDVNTPSAARMYDWLLGGRNNYDADRIACEELLQTAPSTRELALNNRAFLVRVVRHIAQRYEIRQFIDHGSGLPTQNNVHQVAQAVHPDCKVVYVDNDPMVLSYGRALLDENPNVAIVDADMVDTAAIRAGASTLIDFSKPVAALFVSVLHCIPDEKDPRAMIERTVQSLARGSVVVICQLVSPHQHVRETVTRLMERQTDGHWGEVRTEADVHQFFAVDRLTVDKTGLLDVTNWNPDTEVFPRQRTNEWTEYGGLATVD
ncbi:SAM-dependent methyltransferase [Kitasatospora sp. NPDC088351]|uniref:SAM-dependent methyltransferase n=1 Tax=Kitasatospora sp. NPDC088351 TaxID=3155180 RepID=UPI0034387A3D